MMNVMNYTVEEWAEFDGLTVEEINKYYGSKKHGQPVEFYSDEESAVAGVKYTDGTFGCFGAGMDTDGLTEDEMMMAIRAGF